MTLTREQVESDIEDMASDGLSTDQRRALRNISDTDATLRAENERLLKLQRQPLRHENEQLLRKIDDLTAQLAAVKEKYDDALRMLLVRGGI